MLELKNISKVYKGKKINVQALKDVSLNFNDVGFVSVVGTSGCGKTTLLNLIGGLDIDYDGEVIFNDQKTKKYNSKQWDNYRSAHIGFVFQEYNLINTISVYANIEMGLSLIKLTKQEKK